MIEIIIKTDGIHVFNKFNHINSTLKEAGVSLLALEQMKKQLLDIPFENEFEMDEKFEEK